MKRKAGTGRDRARRPGTGAKICLGIITVINLVLTIVASVQRRQDTLRAIKEDDRVQLLLKQQPLKESEIK